MNDADSIIIWDVLRDLGFEPDAKVMSDGTPGLSFDFGNFKLSASSVVNMRFAEVILFTGVLATSRTLAEVDFEIPRRVKSREQCAAWIVWNLDSLAGGLFTPAREVRWLAEGRENQTLLPWVANLAAYDARPRCMVQRDWLRVALKTLRAILATARDEDTMEFGFDGAVLTMKCAGEVVALPAEGSSWPERLAIPARNLQNLPKRLMSERLEVSVFEGRLNIGRNRYNGVSAVGVSERRQD